MKEAGEFTQHMLYGHMEVNSLGLYMQSLPMHLQKKLKRLLAGAERLQFIKQLIYMVEKKQQEYIRQYLVKQINVSIHQLEI
jgi:hypothetical protein